MFLLFLPLNIPGKYSVLHNQMQQVTAPIYQTTRAVEYLK